MPLFKVYHFEGYMRRRTVFVGFDYQAASDFVSEHGWSISPNGCYIAATYPERKAA
jgi:hypothetical protein